jgi:FkbM family methyltransferase
MKNFVVIDSIHGKFIVNRHCDFHAEVLIKTGATHIEDELKNILAVVATLPEGALALDAGANIGFVSVPLANALKVKFGQVLSFEVQKMLYYALCGTVALNDLDNISVFNKGLGANLCELSVPEINYSIPSDFGKVSLVDQAVTSQTSVQIVRIDDLNLSRLDFLKIDVEGMEIDVLEGAAKTIEKYRPWCWVEYWKVERKELVSYFHQLNYTLFTMDHLNVLCAPNDRLSVSGLEIKAPQFV